jgi:hypothetical protein
MIGLPPGFDMSQLMDVAFTLALFFTPIAVIFIGFRLVIKTLRGRGR